MDRREQVQYLNQALLAEMPQYREQAESFPADEISQRRLLRSLMNVRPPMPLAPEFLEVQDALHTDNANELIQDLTKQYNKSRQQAITNELLDIGFGECLME